jgi:transposase InsO family protein
VRRLVDEFRASERRVCGLMEIPRMSYRYRSCRDDSALRERLQRTLRPRPVLTAPNQEWAVDFVSDVAASGRRLRIFTVVDSYTRECLALEVDTSLPSRRVTRALAAIIDRRGAPVAIGSDNGPEVSSRHFLAWCIENRIDAVHIQPGKPTQNAHIESFNGRLRDECLNVSWFWNLFDARTKIAAWRKDYNSRRPHSALRYLTPEEYARRAASPSSASNNRRPTLPQASPDSSAVAVAPAPALTQIRPREEGLRRGPYMKAKRRIESRLNSGTMLDGTGGHVTMAVSLSLR